MGKSKPETCFITGIKMKLIRQIMRSIKVALLMVFVIIPAASSAFAQPAGVTLRARVQVSGDNVTLGDVLAGDDVRLPQDLVLCRAPQLGTVRTLDKNDIAEVLRNRGVEIPLHGPPEIGILRLR